MVTTVRRRRSLGRRRRLSARSYTHRPRSTEVGLFAVAVEDGQDLDGTAVAGDPVGCHRVELCGLAGFDEVLALAEEQPNGAFEHEEPITARVDLRLRTLLRCRDAHLGHDPSRRVVLSRERPLHGAVADVAADRTDDDILVAAVSEKLVDGGL